MNNDNGELTKKAEMLEMDFLREMGVDLLFKYPEIEKHINKLTDILIGENEDLAIADVYTVEEVEGMEQDLDDKINAIGSVSATLFDMKKVVNGMKKSELKTTLISFIESMEMDLC